jgi:CYTH domain-containing protein/CHAD domain-containing protein
VAAEIERKFLVDPVPDWLGDHPSTPIEQGYLAIAERTEVRLRRAERRLTLTAKRGHGEVREEAEIALDRSRFEQLWPLTEGQRLLKTRHLVPLEAGLRAEVDVYGGALEGLVVAEVEFGSEARSRAFQPPGWMGLELTGDADYSNQSLATRGRPAHEPGQGGKVPGVASDQNRAYRLADGESAAEGARRVARGRAGKAVERLREAGDGDFADAVHGARKDLKKLRAVLRLVRDDLGKELFQRENRRYRDAARLLSESRDAEVKLATLRGLEDQFGGKLPAGPLLNWTEALEADRERVAGAGDSEMEAKLARAIELIEAGEEEIPAWPLRAGSWQLLEPGLSRTYGDGRAAHRAAAKEGSAASVHEHRKRAKDLWYDLRLLSDAWPGLLEATADQAHALTDLLGDHHDLTVLAEDLEGRVGVVAERGAFGKAIAQRQAELLDGALDLGERVYAEKPKHFRRRLRAYWRAWRERD